MDLITNRPCNLYTTSGEVFTDTESVQLARLVLKRFGRDPDAAAAAWRRLLGNSCDVSSFVALTKTHIAEDD